MSKTCDEYHAQCLRAIEEAVKSSPKKTVEEIFNNIQCKCDATDLLINLLKDLSSRSREFHESTGPVLESFMRWSDKSKVALTPEKRLELLEIFVRIDTPGSTYNKAINKLIRINNDGLATNFSRFLKAAIASGNASLSAIEFGMQRNTEEIDEVMLKHALLLGFDDTKTVKDIAKKSKTWTNLQQAFKEAKNWGSTKEIFDGVVNSQNIRMAVDYNKFRLNVAKLGESFGIVEGARMDSKKTYESIKHFIHEYKTKKILFVQLHEILYHLLAEYPFRKDRILQLMEKQKFDADEVDEIRNIEFVDARKNEVPEIQCERLREQKRAENALVLPENVTVKFVPEDADFSELIEKLTMISASEFPFVGIDMECNPHAVWHNEYARLLQIATRNEVFLVKLDADPKNLAALCDLLYKTKQLYKLCMGSKNDTKALQSVLPDNCDALSNASSVVDIRRIYAAANLTPTIKEKGTSLSQMCEILLGQALEKFEQLSLWSRTPLRQSQIDYAALDAYCLLMLLEEIKKRYCADEVPFDQLVKNCAEG